MKQILSIILIFSGFFAFSQNATVTFQGKILNHLGNPIPYATISTYKETTITNEKGAYLLTTSANDTVRIFISCIGYTSIEKLFYPKENQTITYSPILHQNAIDIPKIKVVYNKQQEENVTYLNQEKTTSLAGLSLSGIEGSIKTLAGVSSKSELSSQYSVRGGSYDENLVYINGIPAFKPNLTSSDKQEGLSIINPYMVGSVDFSSGGFGVQYGDKMSSVLNVYYKDVEKKQLEFDGSLMDANLTLQGLSDSSKFSYLIGARYKNTSLLLNSLDENGEYRPQFYDIQSILKYTISPKTKISYWLYGANNTYNFIPKDRITDFGNQIKTFRMKIYFDGNEEYTYKNLGNSITLHYNPQSHTFLDFSVLYYSANEHENFDVFSQYRLSEIIPTDDNTSTVNDSTTILAIGSFLEHGRNSLSTNTSQFIHNGKYIFNNGTVSWGVSLAANNYNAIYNEWTYIDSASYSIPYNDTQITLKNAKNSTITHSQNVSAVYANISKRIEFNNTSNTTLKVSGGIRSTYDTYSAKILHNPRLRLLLKPNSKKDIAISLSLGRYYQIAQFKELITTTGILELHVKPQKSSNYVLGYSQGLKIWNRPFVFQSEMYVKLLQSIIPYTINNVSTIYYPNLEANGYIAGIDAKLNGEFVPGVESWINLSCMKAREQLSNGLSDQIRRPNDQLINFGMFFQDYLPGSENLKMNLTYLIGSKIPTSIPDAAYNEFDDYSIPVYTRIDIGFLMILLDETKNTSKKTIKNMWVGAEIFNLLDNANKISYFWIEDANQNFYGVPNYLTSRRLNVKLSIRI